MEIIFVISLILFVWMYNEGTKMIQKRLKEEEPKD